jgi:hypothetical protein
MNNDEPLIIEAKNVQFVEKNTKNQNILTLMKTSGNMIMMWICFLLFCCCCCCVALLFIPAIRSIKMNSLESLLPVKINLKIQFTILIITVFSREKKEREKKTRRTSETKFDGYKNYIVFRLNDKSTDSFGCMF